MSDTKGQHEPSMEEILASIRRIIAEDGDAPEGEGAPAASKAAASEDKDTPLPAEDDVLELTEVVEEDRPVTSSADDAAPHPHEEPVFRIDPEPDVASSTGKLASPEGLLSTTTAAASVAALTQLVSHGQQRDKSSEMALGGTNRTLEDVVRELLRPLLKDWLDQNLPQLVERLVQDEIARLVRQAQGR